jgi:hypothetical protein
MWLLVFAAGAAGCTSGHADLNITSRDSHQVYFENFSRAYLSSPHEGEYDIMLIDDDLPSHHDDGHGPLQPVSHGLLRQVMHIHVLWRPQGGASARESSVTNALVDWYVFGDRGEGHDDMQHYGGAGFVRLYNKEGASTVDIRGCQLQPRISRGAMRDPIGPALLEGRVFAVHDDQRVYDLLAQMQDQAGEHRSMALIEK